jgi:hypothetical protein
MSHFKDQYENICPGVHVWKGFLSKEELVPIREELEAQDWSILPTLHAHGLKSLLGYRERIINSLNMPDADIPEIEGSVRRGIDQGMEPHVDVPNYLNPIYWNEIDKNSDIEKTELKAARYGMIIYLNDDYEDGDICYPQYDFCYKPKAGDIVIHEANNIHAVKKVRSGYRYTHSSYIRDSFWLPLEVVKNLDWPDHEKNLSESNDPRLYYSLSHGKSLNPSLRKFQETFVDEGKY